MVRQIQKYLRKLNSTIGTNNSVLKNPQCSRKREIAASCNKSQSFLSKVMSRRPPLSLEFAEAMISFSKGISQLKEIYPIDKTKMLASSKTYLWYSQLSAQEKKELAELCNISMPWLSRMMTGKAPIRKEISNTIIACSEARGQSAFLKVM